MHIVIVLATLVLACSNPPPDPWILETSAVPVADLKQPADPSSALTRAAGMEIVEGVRLAMRSEDYPLSDEEADSLRALKASFDRTEGIVDVGSDRMLTIPDSRTLTTKCADQSILISFGGDRDKVGVSCSSDLDDSRFRVAFPKGNSFVVRVSADQIAPPVRLADTCPGEGSLFIRPDRAHTVVYCYPGDKEFNDLGTAFILP